jgi:hypothetical protein
MKKLLLLFIVIFIQACTPKGQGLISHGVITQDGYVTSDNCVLVDAPDGWSWNIGPYPEFETGIAGKIVRPHEIGYLTAGSQDSLIIIESTMLTWGGKPIIPIDITWDASPERTAMVCEKMMERERGGNFTDYQYECLMPKRGSFCDPYDPCLMSWRKRTSSRNGSVVYEKTYMVGKPPISSELNDKSLHGWKITHTFVGTPQEAQRGYEAMEALGKSMHLICQ